MRMKMNLWMLGIAAMLASCSSEDLLQGTNADSDVVHITVQLADGMKTRAAVDEDPNESAGVDRYVLNAYEVGAGGHVSDQKANVEITDLKNGNFTAKLDRKKTYKFYCWADEGEESSYTIGADNDLSSITLKEKKNPTIAHRGESDVVNGANDAPVKIQMTHAVAKVVLQTTSDLTAHTAQFVMYTYKVYNAITGEASGATQRLEGINEVAATGASKENPKEVLQLYTLIGKKVAQSALINYTTVAEDFRDPYTHIFDNAPFQADYRTVFKGDIAGLQYSKASVTATLDGNWAGEYIQGEADKENHSITTFEAGQLTTALIEQAVADGTDITLTLSGPMNNTDVQVLYDYISGESNTHVSALDISGMIGVTELITEKFSNAPNLKKVILPHSIKTFEAGQLTKAAIEQAVAGGTGITLTLSGPMNDTDAQALYDYFYERTDTPVSTLDMSGVTELTTIKDETFYNTKNLKDVKLPTSVTKIEVSAFEGSGLQTITANKVTTVEGGAFRNCLKLEKLSLPSVTTFNGESIFNCKSLKILKLTSPGFDGKLGSLKNYSVKTENIDLYVHQNLKKKINGNSIGESNFKSIKFVDDDGNEVP